MKQTVNEYAIEVFRWGELWYWEVLRNGVAIAASHPGYSDKQACEKGIHKDYLKLTGGEFKERG